jgi:hypothetical protein
MFYTQFVSKIHLIVWPEQDGYLYPVLPTKPLELTTTQNIVSVAEFAVHLETDISTFGLKHNVPKGGSTSSQASKSGATSAAGKK